MPMANQPARHSSLDDLGNGTTSTSSITCRTCGCLNFSSDDECEKCRSARTSSMSDGAVPTVRHPFVPTARPTNGAMRTSATNGTSRPGPGTSIRSVRPLSSNVRTTTDTKENANPGRGVNASATPSRSHVTSQLGVTSKEPARQEHTGAKEASRETAIRGVQPGSSSVSSAQPTLSLATAGKNQPSTAPSTTTTGQADTTSSALSVATGDNRSRDAKSTSSKEIIDLISSDEESENHLRRAAKRARQEARIQKSISRLALRNPAQEQDANPASIDVDRESDEQPRHEPRMGRFFDDVSFNPNDFPSQAEVTHAMRGARRAGSIANSVASSAVSTPTSTFLAPTPTAISISMTTPNVVSNPAHTAVSTLPPTNTTASAPPLSSTASTSADKSAPVRTSPPHATDKATPRGQASTVIAASTAPAAATPTPSTSSLPVATMQTSPSSEPSSTHNRLHPSQCPIVLDDSDDDSDANDGDEPRLFLSRRFKSVVFNEHDFLSEHDGLNLARRSIVPDSPPATRTSPVDSAAPAHPQRSNSNSASTVREQAPNTINGPNVLQARRKVGLTGNNPPAQQETKIKIEQPASFRPSVVRIIKPTLGHCSTDFFQFMHDSVDDEDMEDDEDLARAKLLEVVDLTNLTDESPDDDDDDDDYFETVEPTTFSDPQLANDDGSNAGKTGSSSMANATEGMKGKPVENGHLQAAPPVVKRTRAPRPKETCALCEEKAWVRALINCPDCKKFYHKRCARDYGDETICWACNLDGMIDDSELTEDHKNEVMSIFGALRQSSETEQGDDDEEEREELEEKADTANMEGQPSLPFNVSGTRSARRWKEFLDVSTAPMEETFHTVTNAITQELQDEVAKAKYSKGFATKEEIENGMAQVVDHFADLQDREERLQKEQKEERSRASDVEAASTAEAETSTAGETIEHGPVEATVSGMAPRETSPTTDGFVSK